MYSAAYVWAKVLARLEQQLSEVTVSTWLDDTEVIELTETGLILYTPSDYRQEIIRTRCASYIEEALNELLHTPVKLTVWGETELKRFKEEKPATDTVPLNPQFSFENYVEGAKKSFAKRITETVANCPGASAYNPLFLYGSPGVGKTHLLYASANRIIETKPGLKVVCMKTEAFINEFIDAIRNERTNAFKQKIRNADVLLLDDIQFIAGKESTQEEVYHIFDTLYENGRQIILTSDRRPWDMPTLTSKLQARFGEGIMVEVIPPDFDTRYAIVRRNAEKYGLQLTEELMQTISRSAQNVRQVEGVLKKLHAFHEFSNIPIDCDTVDSVLSELVIRHTSRRATTDMILQQVCSYYHVTAQDLKGIKRSKTVTEPRQIAMYLMQSMLEMRYDDIAKVFSRDRATVIHSIKKVDGLYAQEDGHFRKIVSDIRGAIEDNIK